MLSLNDLITSSNKKTGVTHDKISHQDFEYFDSKVESFIDKRQMKIVSPHDSDYDRIKIIGKSKWK